MISYHRHVGNTALPVKGWRCHGGGHLVHEVTQVHQLLRGVQGPQQHLAEAPHPVVLIDGVCCGLPHGIGHLLTDLHPPKTMLVAESNLQGYAEHQLAWYSQTDLKQHGRNLQVLGAILSSTKPGATLSTVCCEFSCCAALQRMRQPLSARV